MFVIKINGVDSSCHTLQVDAEAQQQRFIDGGATNIEIVETDTFNPPPLEV